MKYFFVVILWDKLFKNKSYDFVLIRALEYIERATQYSDMFANWLQDLPAEYVKHVISAMHASLEANLKQLV